MMRRILKTHGKKHRLEKLNGLQELIDASIVPGVQGNPLMHVIAAKAVAFGEALKQVSEPC